MSDLTSIITPMKLKRSNDRKVANLVTKNGKQAAIANTFGLPAGKEFSCPGATSVCESVCYAGKLEKIQKGNWMGKPPYSKNNPKLFEIDEFECLDIDFDWQFDLYTHYWEKLYG